MIVSQTPLRISFIGGGTDLEDFYRQYPGRVLSTTINKYIYINTQKKFDGMIKIAYSRTENVDHRDKIQHTRVKAALGETGIEKGIEIGSMADIPAGTGLGSSSSYTVGLLNALYAFSNKNMPVGDLAEKACQIEINKLKEPIGKQDQYIAAFGGMNLINFNPDGKVKVEPVYLTPKIKEAFQNHLLLFYTGIKRLASSILTEQKQKINKKFETLKEMSDMVPVFRSALEKGDFKRLGQILDLGWQKKKTLSSGINNPQIKEMYSLALKNGAWGGKILGAGGGGFLLVIAPSENHSQIKNALSDYQSTPFKFSEAGSKIVFRT